MVYATSNYNYYSMSLKIHGEKISINGKIVCEHCESLSDWGKLNSFGFSKQFQLLRPRKNLKTSLKLEELVFNALLIDTSYDRK